MTISAPDLATWQRCPRLWLLNQSGEPRRWRPKSLFLSQLRRGVMRLSRGDTLESVSLEACASLMEKAAVPGLDVTGIEPYTLARDLCACLRTVLARVHTCKAQSLSASPTILLSNGHKWAVRAPSDDSGMLHSWIAVEKLNGNVLSRELHSWSVFGDMAATGRPMLLHVVEIGRQKDSHQHTPWCKAYAHPHVLGRFAFQKQDGSQLGAGWKPLWYQDSLRNNPKTWLALMERDQVNAIKDVPVKAVTPRHAREFKAQVLREADRMQETLNRSWEEEPMRRGACDMPLCAWQHKCYV